MNNKLYSRWRFCAKRTVLFLSIAFLSAACQTVPVAPQESVTRALAFTPPAGKANLYVVRPDSLLGSGLNIRVLLDFTRAEALADDTYKIARVDPGVHTITQSSLQEGSLFQNNRRSTTIDVVAGRNYFIEISLDGAHHIRNEVVGREMVRDATLAVGDFSQENVDFAHIDTNVPDRVLHTEFTLGVENLTPREVMYELAYAAGQSRVFRTGLLERKNRIALGRQVVSVKKRPWKAATRVDDGMRKFFEIAGDAHIEYYWPWQSVGENDSHTTRSCIEFAAEPGRTYAVDPWGKCVVNKQSGSDAGQRIVCRASLVDLDTQQKVNARFFRECGEDFYLKGTL